MHGVNDNKLIIYVNKTDWCDLVVKVLFLPLYISQNPPMRKEKFRFNEELRRYIKAKRRLLNLRIRHVNVRKQAILVKRIEKLSANLYRLLGTIRFRELVAASAITFAVNVVHAQIQPSFAPPVQAPFMLDYNLGSESNFSFSDLDGDGDQDLMATDNRREFYYYENIGTKSAPQFVESNTNSVSGFHSGSYFSTSFEDLDNDGDQDMIYGNRSGDITYLENSGDSLSPVFSSKLTNPFSLTQLEDWCTPELVDLNSDGLIDIFSGDRHGDFTFFKNIGTPQVPEFDTARVHAFGTVEVTNFVHVDFADLDADADLDLIVTDNYGTFTYFENIGSATEPAFAAPVTNPFSLELERFRRTCVAFEDIDDDGDQDIMVGASGSFRFFENIGTPQVPQFAPYVNAAFGLPGGLGNITSVALADLNGDCTTDLISGERSGGFYYFENGSDTYSEAVFDSVQRNPFGFGNGSKNADDITYGYPHLIDIDGDNDLDMLSGDYGGEFHYFENIGDNGNPVFATKQLNPFGLKDIGKRSNFDMADLDGDGDQDLLSGEYEDGFVWFENIGDAQNPEFSEPVANPFSISENFNEMTVNVIFTDLDGDEDYDFISGTYSGNIYYFENIGDFENPIFAEPLKDTFGLQAIDDGRVSPQMGDLDGDGDEDLLMGSRSGNFYFVENTASLGIAKKFPRDNSENVDPELDIEVVYSQFVKPGINGSIYLMRVDDSVVVAELDIQTEVVFDKKNVSLPFGDLDVLTEYAILIPDSVVENLADERTSGVSDLTSWSFTTGKYRQSITFDSIPEKKTSDANFLLSAIASSGLEVMFESGDNDIVSINDNLADLTGPGTTIVTASQAGNETFEPAVAERVLVVKLITNTDQGVNDVNATYPNPATDVLHVQFNEVITTSQLIDNLGNIVKEVNQVSSRKFTLDISSLKSGVYTLISRDDSGQVIGRQTVMLVD